MTVTVIRAENRIGRSSRLAAFQQAAGRDGMGRDANCLATSVGEGLPNALARKAAPEIGEMPVGDIVASLSADQKDRPKKVPVSATTRSQPATAPVARVPQAEVNAAVARAVAAEQTRSATVYASEHSKGRERVCAKLLASEKQFAAAVIVAQLPHLPTDRDLAVRDAAGKNAATDAVWNKARGITAPQPADANSAGTQTDTASDCVWDRAWGSGQAQPPIAAAAPSSAGDAVWDRAWGRKVA